MSGLFEVRTHKGLSQFQLAMASGVPQQTISAIESGKRENPGVLTVLRLAEALDCEVEELYPGRIQIKEKQK